MWSYLGPSTYGPALGMVGPAGSTTWALVALHSCLMVICCWVLGLVAWYFGYLGILSPLVLRWPRPEPGAHSGAYEVSSSVLPSVLLAQLGVPSFRALYALSTYPVPCGYLAAEGHQWYWSYYVTQGATPGEPCWSSSGDSYLGTPEGPLGPLHVDAPVVLPSGVPCSLVTTSADVIHSWAVPALGIKVDAIPGRLNEASVVPGAPGVAHGQCSELCGSQHALMPVEVRIV